ncbi:hypothetical protein DFJ74DRAFT_713724 [Hyaloraphidium curvatum]|nr:hypothetical protein DFJ74DRAFT_713724 [Hyaloraphidium curvatum]
MARRAHRPHAADDEPRRHTVRSLAERGGAADIASPTFSPDVVPAGGELPAEGGLELPPPASDHPPPRPPSLAASDASLSPRLTAVNQPTSAFPSAHGTPPRQNSPHHLLNPYTAPPRPLRPSEASFDDEEHDEHPLVLQLPGDLLRPGEYSSSPPRVRPRAPFRHPMYVSAVWDSAREAAAKADGAESDDDAPFSPKSVPRGLHSRPSVRIEPWIDAGRQTLGIFLRKDVADELGLRVVGRAGTQWGVEVDRLSPVQLHLFTRSARLDDVFLLPRPFETHATYSGGLISIDCLWAAGLSVIIEAGEIYLQDSEASDVQFRGEHAG